MNDFERQPAEGERQTPDGEKSAETITKILAIIGLIALLALAAWVSVQVIRFAPSVFSSVSSGVSSATVSITSLFGGQEQPLSFDMQSLSATSGQAAVLTFTHAAAQENQEYALTFSCTPGATLAAQTNDDGSFDELSCGEPHIFVSEQQSITVRPSLLLDDQESAEMTITLAALAESGEAAYSDDTLVTVRRGTALVEKSGADTDDEPQEDGAEDSEERVQQRPTGAPQAAAPAAAPSRQQPEREVVFVPGTGASDPSGRPDLALRVLATGMQVEVDGEDRFFAVDEVPADENAAVKFEVINLGTKTSEEFTFAAELPIIGNDDYLFESDTQQALRPGERIEYTLAFDRANPDDDGATIAFTLLPEGDDEETQNNFAEATIDIADE